MTNEEVFVGTVMPRKRVLVKILNETEENHNGIVLKFSKENMARTLQGRVLKAGPDCVDVNPGDIVLIPKHFKYDHNLPDDMLIIEEDRIEAVFIQDTPLVPRETFSS